MTDVQISKYVNLSTDSTALIDDYKARVIASGVGLLFVYLVNFICQAYVTFVKSDEGKLYAKKKLLQTCQVLYWYGIASKQYP